MTQTTPTRDEAVLDESKVTTAMIDAAFKVCPAGAISEIGTGGMQRMIAAALASAPAPAIGRVDADEVKRIRDWLLERNRDHLAAMHERTHIMSRKDGDAEMFLDAAILLCHLASLPPAATPVSEAGGERSGYISADNGQGMGLPECCVRYRCGGEISDNGNDNICQKCGASYGRD